MATRRDFLKTSVATGAGLMVGWNGIAGRAFAAPIAGGSLDPRSIPKYALRLVVPPAMPRTDVIIERGRGPVDYFEIAVRQFRQRVLPLGLPTTRVWGYGSVNHPGSFHTPSLTLEGTVHRPVRVRWINQLRDDSGRFLRHLLPVDPSVHWANPEGGLEGRDMHPMHDSTPHRYQGPVPLVTHVHGARTADESDGFPSAWFLPVARDIPTGFAKVGSRYDYFREKFLHNAGVAWPAGSAISQYDNHQHAGTMWFHDHTLGMTRVNLYAGPVGFYLLRGGADDLPAGMLPGPGAGVGSDPFGRHFEIPLAVQDRSFNVDGSLFYPGTRGFFDGFEGPYVPDSDVPPIWNPEFFGNAMMVNGRTWPLLEVEPRRYRLRILNGCNSRFLVLKLATEAMAQRPSAPALPFWLIGMDSGFVPHALQLEQLLLAPSERADVIVDFTRIPVGTELYLLNEGPDEPFGGGVAETDFAAADPETTGQVMKFRIVSHTGKDLSIAPAHLHLPAYKPMATATHTRRVSLNELASGVPGFDGPIAALLGTLDASANPEPRGWPDPVTEHPALDSTEIWEIHNFTEDAHPIHPHLVRFQVLDRQPFEGTRRAPEPWESGRKDTLIAYPGEITRFKAVFDLPGHYVWHCHIAEHEDNEMMRPYDVGPV